MREFVRVKGMGVHPQIRVGADSALIASAAASFAAFVSAMSQRPVFARARPPTGIARYAMTA